MNDRTFTKNVFLLTVFILVLTGCSNYKDQQSIPPENLPESVIKVMSNAFPDATDATFQTVEKDKLYEVYYKLKGDPFYAALNTEKILSVYRMYGAVPDSMQQSLPVQGVQGGKADLYKEPVPQPSKQNIFTARYAWNNLDYLLTWFPNAPTNPIKYLVKLEPYSKFSYTIYQDERYTLPAQIISFLEREKLRFTSAKISLNEKNEKQYLMSATTASSTNYEFTFDQSGKLINTIYRAEAFYYNIEELPDKIQTFIKSSSGFSPMKIAEGYKFSDPVGTGYVINMEGMNEQCWINFDQEGNFVNMTYQTALYR
ncbi:hypothetical protein LZD49_06855 [Dyadobacter sp. CY261]|uniref:hypothetical protein n=1 Tax=Dyadobacter sp. CY261 TaxID=2907203 RepID=UPI001F457F8A|nr:hypothetical protein [Dyadobacter sp. CY261]MCF0070184.1 hypothetical protein [Dyadobacter sp. CY261]